MLNLRLLGSRLTGRWRASWAERQTHRKTDCFKAFENPDGFRVPLSDLCGNAKTVRFVEDKSQTAKRRQLVTATLRLRCFRL